MTVWPIRTATAEDWRAIRAVETRAFGRPDEADLVDRIVADGDDVLELVAGLDHTAVGHILFSRLRIRTTQGNHPAVALAPVAVDPDLQNEGIGSMLIDAAHARLQRMGETLSVVLGWPAYYGRFGYTHARAAAFGSAYQGEALQALAWGEAPMTGELIYPRAFGGGA